MATHCYKAFALTYFFFGVQEKGFENLPEIGLGVLSANLKKMTNHMTTKSDCVSKILILQNH